MKLICKWCGDNSEGSLVKSYREIDGTTSSEITCRECMGLNNKTVIKIREERTKNDDLES